jgi:hypothetical protein
MSPPAGRRLRGLGVMRQVGIYFAGRDDSLPRRRHLVTRPGDFVFYQKSLPHGRGSDEVQNHPVE